MSAKKGKSQQPSDESRGVEDILGGLMGSNAGGMPQGGAADAPAGGSDLAGMLGGLMGGGGASGQGGGDLMGMLGGLLGGGSQQGSGVSAGGPSIISALLPLVMGMLSGSKRSGGVDIDERTSNELQGMFGAAQSGQLDVDQIRSSGVVQDVASQTGASQDEVADTLAQLMRMLGSQG